MPGSASVRTRTRGEPTDPASRRELERNVLRQLRVVFSSAKLHFRAVKKQCGVTGAQLWALYEIREHRGLRVSELAQFMAIQLSTASNLLEKLDAQGLIVRTRTDRDQRVVRIRLTARGERVVSRAPSPARGVVPDALTQVSQRSLKALDERLEDLIRHMLVVDRKAVSKPLSEI